MDQHKDELCAPKSVLRSVLSNRYPCDARRYARDAAALKETWRISDGGLAKIGAGACGEVFQMTGEGCTGVAKRAKTDK